MDAYPCSGQHYRKETMSLRELDSPYACLLLRRPYCAVTFKNINYTYSRKSWPEQRAISAMECPFVVGGFITVLFLLFNLSIKVIWLHYLHQVQVQIQFFFFFVLLFIYFNIFMTSYQSNIILSILEIQSQPYG